MKYDEISDFTKGIFANDKYVKNSSIGKRLVADLHEKKDVLMHYMYVAELLKLGVKIHITQVLVLDDQMPFMKSFVEDRKQRREEATDDFTRLQQKFLVNSIYGKSKSVFFLFFLQHNLDNIFFDLVKKFSLFFHIRHSKQSKFSNGRYHSKRTSFPKNYLIAVI